MTFRNGNNSIFGSLNLKRSGADWASAVFNTLNARSAPNAKFRSSDHFSTLLRSTSGRGRLTGSFFGANAAEAGGTFNLSKREGTDRGSAIGVFRAKNVGNVVGDISDADRLKLFSGNHAIVTDIHFFRGIIHRHASHISLGNLSLLNSSSLTLRYLRLKESTPNSDPAKENTLVPSERIKVHAKDFGDYSYIAWGAWSSGKNTRIIHNGRQMLTPGGHWIYGQRLKAADIPISGSTRYAGQLMGGWHSDWSNREMNSITGDINMAVTFRDSNFSLSGSMNLYRHGKYWATGRFNNPNISSSILQNQGHLYHFMTGFSGDGDAFGSLSGNFFGANAAEVGGEFSFFKGREFADGVFRAKKQ